MQKLRYNIVIYRIETEADFKRRMKDGAKVDRKKSWKFYSPT